MEMRFFTTVLLLQQLAVAVTAVSPLFFPCLSKSNFEELCLDQLLPLPDSINTNTNNRRGGRTPAISQHDYATFLNRLDCFLATSSSSEPLQQQQQQRMEMSRCPTQKTSLRGNKDEDTHADLSVNFMALPITMQLTFVGAVCQHVTETTGSECSVEEVLGSSGGGSAGKDFGFFLNGEEDFEREWLEWDIESLCRDTYENGLKTGWLDDFEKCS